MSALGNSYPTCWDPLARVALIFCLQQVSALDIRKPNKKFQGSLVTPEGAVPGGNLETSKLRCLQSAQNLCAWCCLQQFQAEVGYIDHEPWEVKYITLGGPTETRHPRGRTIKQRVEPIHTKSLKN